MSGARYLLLRLGLSIVLVLGALFSATVGFTGLTLAVGDPFYARIWKETERMLGGEVPQSGLGFWTSARDALVLVVLGALAGVGVFVIGLVPGVGAVLGLGALTQLFFLVPLGAVVVMPAAVAGATMLARDLLEEGTAP